MSYLHGLSERCPPSTLPGAYGTPIEKRRKHIFTSLEICTVLIATLLLVRLFVEPIGKVLFRSCEIWRVSTVRKAKKTKQPSVASVSRVSKDTDTERVS